MELIESSKDKLSPRDVIFNLERYTYTAFFDGACTRKRCSAPVGAYGLVILDNKGKILLKKSGSVECEEIVTNNICEIFALLQVAKILRDWVKNPFERL